MCDDVFEDVVVKIDPNIWYTTLDRNLTIPIFEDEDGDSVYGYGHINPKTFCMMVNLYDQVLVGPNEYTIPYRQKAVRRVWAQAYKREDRLEEDWFRFEWKDVSETDEHAFPLTFVERR